LNWYHDYDANVLGGLLLGAGMTLAGACPGTVLVQVVMGIRTAYLTFAGRVLGGYLYSIIGPSLSRPSTTTSKILTSKEEKRDPNPLTLYATFSLKKSYATLIFQVACIIIVSSTAYLTPKRTDILFQPIAGGLLIGGAQLVSLTLTGDTVGISTGYERLGSLAIQPVTPREGWKCPDLGSIFFGIGVLAGSFILSQAIPLPQVGQKFAVGAGNALIGGVMLIFGARMAGGCTSGHGISGLSTLSISSFVTASMFAGGMGLAALLP
jgi:uncharacterized membrane protein YedE/YeeE